MKAMYAIRYSLKAILHRHDRIFSLLNGISVAVTMLILVALTGLLKAFKDYSEKIISQYPLRIEIFKAENVLFNDLSAIEADILALPGVASCFKRVPTAINFINAQGSRLPFTPRGSTILPEEPLNLKDIRGKTARGETLRLRGKKELNSPYDEVGIIVSFDFLKTLGYFPQGALPNQPSSWEGSELPQAVTMAITEAKKDNPKETRLPVPVVGVVATMRDAYIITEDLYDIIGCWQHEFRYMLKDENGQPLMVPESKIVSAYYRLKDEEGLWVDENWGTEVRVLAIPPEAIVENGQKENIVWLDEHPKLEKKYTYLLKIRVYYQYWEAEERLVVSPDSLDMLKPQQIELVDRKLRNLIPLRNLGQIALQKEEEAIGEWRNYPLDPKPHQYIQAAVYAKERKDILPLMEELSKKGVVPSSPLKDYLKTFDRQEKFFVRSAIAVFLLILFLAAIVLFSTFYASVQRKRRQIGILKACGASRRLIRRLYYLESSIVLIFGMALGIFGGLKAGEAMTRWISSFVQLTETHLTFSLPAQYILPLVLVVSIFCWLAIFIPAQTAATTDPAQVVRN